MIPPPVCKSVLVEEIGYVYLLRSLRDERFYLGWTTDIKRRLSQHNNGKSPYTKFRRPWELVGYEVYLSVVEAKEREKKLKRNPRMYKLFKKRMLARHATGVLTQVVG